MKSVYRDIFNSINKIDIYNGEDIFKRILREREYYIDEKRFFLRYVPVDTLLKYDFNNFNDVDKFRNVYFSSYSPFVLIGGCNNREDALSKDIRMSGIKMSDPSGKVVGQFDVRNGKLTYSPFFPFFYNEKELVDFAKDEYFTSLTFEDIMMNQIDNSSSFYIHTGYYSNPRIISKRGPYILEKITKDDMINFVKNGEEGRKILIKK